MTGRASSPLLALLTRLARIKGVVAAALTTADGLPVAATGRASESQMAELRSATVAAIFGAVDRALPGLELGQVHSATIETTTYVVFLRGAEDLVLSAIARRDVDHEKVRAEIERVSTVLAQVKSTFKGS